MDELLSVTWKSLSSPIPLSLIVVILMQFFFKKIIDLLLGLAPEDTVTKVRGLSINVVTLGVCCLLAALHIGEQFPVGDAFVVSVQAFALATSEYEAVKGLLKFLGRIGT